MVDNFIMLLKAACLTAVWAIVIFIVVMAGCLIVIGIKSAINAKLKNSEMNETEELTLISTTIILDVASTIICEGKNKHPEYKGLNHIETMNRLMDDCREKVDKIVAGDSNVKGSEGD